MTAARIAEREHQVARARARGRMFMILGLFALFFIIKACTPERPERTETGMPATPVTSE